jgi:RecA-family ATPase
MYILSLEEVLNLPARTGFLVEKILPKGALCSLVGESEVGKSQLINQIGFAIAAGRTDFLGLKIDALQRRVLFVATEDSPHFLKTRFEYLSQQKSIVNQRIDFLFEAETNLPEDIKKYLENKLPDLIVLDHWMDVFEGDGNSGASVRKFLKPFGKIAEDSGACILLLHHYRKTNSRQHDKMDVLGSQSYEAKMRSVIALENTGTDQLRRLKIIKSNLLSDSEKKLVLNLAINANWQFELNDDAVHGPENITEDKSSIAEKILKENNLLGLSCREAVQVLKKVHNVDVSKTLVANIKKRNTGK